jgi:hypothetical protein
MEKIENPGRERILARIRSALSTPRRFDIGLVRGQWSEFGQKGGTNPATTGGVLAED